MQKGSKNKIEFKGKPRQCKGTWQINPIRLKTKFRIGIIQTFQKPRPVSGEWI